MPSLVIMQLIQIFQHWELIKLFELIIISIPLLLLTSLLIYKLNPRYCSRCERGTYFPLYQHLQKNPDWPVQRYCLKCFFWINLSVWKCDNCHSSGTHRIHKLNFISRWLVIKSKKNVYHTCQCGNTVELTQK